MTSTFQDLSLSSIVIFNTMNSNDLLIGEIIMWPNDYTDNIPYNCLSCNGQSLSKTDANYSDLYDIIGIKYGGDTNNFNLPNLNDSDNKLTRGVSNMSGTSSISFPNVVSGGYEKIEYNHIPLDHIHNINNNKAFLTLNNSLNLTTCNSFKNIDNVDVRCADKTNGASNSANKSNNYSGIRGVFPLTHTHNINYNTSNVTKRINSNLNFNTGSLDVTYDLNVANNINVPQSSYDPPHVKIHYIICYKV